MPVPSVNQCCMKWVPTVPWGSGRSDSLASRTVSMARQASTTRSPDSWCDSPSSSIQVTPVALRPDTSTSTTHERSRTSAPAATARRSGARAPMRARMGQPWFEHCPQLLQGGRPS
jgi:hypothetical protein